MHKIAYCCIDLSITRLSQKSAKNIAKIIPVRRDNELYVHL